MSKPQAPELQTDNGATATFTGSVVVPGAADMWDLTISGVHDFYVSTSTSTVLVHNCPVPPRDVHSIIRSIDHGLEPDEYARVGTNGERYVQAATHADDEAAVDVLDYGDGRSGVVIRAFDDLEGNISNFETNTSAVLDKLASGEWFSTE